MAPHIFPFSIKLQTWRVPYLHLKPSQHPLEDLFNSWHMGWPLRVVRPSGRYGATLGGPACWRLGDRETCSRRGGARDGGWSCGKEGTLGEFLLSVSVVPSQIAACLEAQLTMASLRVLPLDITQAQSVRVSYSDLMHLAKSGKGPLSGITCSRMKRKYSIHSRKVTKG